MAAVLVSDQLTKWSAWRHYDQTLINTGGYILLGPTIRSWYSAPVSGAVLDVLGLVTLALGGRLLLRLQPSVLVAGATAVVAGLASNLLDRLGLHRFSAPGSERGVVDFLPSPDGGRGNVADLWIVLGLLAVLAVEVRSGRATADRQRPTSSVRRSGTMPECPPSAPPPRPRGVRRST